MAAAVILVLFMAFGGKYFWREIWFILEMCVLTFLTRAVVWKTSVSTLLKGLYIGGGLTLLFNGTLGWIFPNSEDSVFFNGFVVGFTEELFKFIPVVLVAYIIYKQRKAMISASDWLWLSAISGTVFSLAEKLFYADVYFPFTYGPHLGFIHFFPDALGIYAQGDAFGYIGHGAATAFIGLTVALGLYLKQKVAAMKPIWWLIPLAGYLWISLEHAFNNSYYTDPSNTWLLLGGGQVTPYLFIMALLAVLGIEWLRLHAYLKKNPKTLNDFTTKIKKLPTIFRHNANQGVKGVWLLGIYWRLLNFLSQK